jgi:hypothetical protein
LLKSGDSSKRTPFLTLESGQDTHVKWRWSLHVLILLGALRVIVLLLHSPLAILEVVRLPGWCPLPINKAYRFLIVLAVLKGVHHLMMLI